MPPGSEAVRAKAADMAEAGSVIIVDQDAGRLVARVGAYTVKHSPGGRWRCDYVAGWYGQGCSHAEAVRLVTEPQG